MALLKFVLVSVLTLILIYRVDASTFEHVRQDDKAPLNSMKRATMAKAYHELPWEQLSEFNFYPRQLSPYVFNDEDAENEWTSQPTSTADTDHQHTPSRTIEHFTAPHNVANKKIAPRSTFTFVCPTSVQCNDGGCCPLGDYCATRNGQLGCCPIGSECDAMPIPGCSVSCFGICCDTVQGIIGVHVCSPTPGEGGQSSGLCIGVAPTSPLYLPPGSCPIGEL